MPSCMCIPSAICLFIILEEHSNGGFSQYLPKVCSKFLVGGGRAEGELFRYQQYNNGVNTLLSDNLSWNGSVCCIRLHQIPQGTETCCLLTREFILFPVSLCKNNVKQQKNRCHPPSLTSSQSHCKTQSSKGEITSLHRTNCSLTSIMGNSAIHFNRIEIWCPL